MPIFMLVRFDRVIRIIIIVTTWLSSKRVVDHNHHGANVDETIENGIGHGGMNDGAS